GVAPFLKRLPPAVVVQEENTLIEWRHDCRRALGHVAAIVPWRRWSGGGFGRRFFARASAVGGGRRSTSSSRGTLRRAKVWPRSAGRDSRRIRRAASRRHVVRRTKPRRRRKDGRNTPSARDARTRSFRHTAESRRASAPHPRPRCTPRARARDRR